jgi:hypothetical protein
MVLMAQLRDLPFMPRKVLTMVGSVGTVKLVLLFSGKGVDERGEEVVK